MPRPPRPRLADVGQRAADDLAGPATRRDRPPPPGSPARSAPPAWPPLGRAGRRKGRCTAWPAIGPAGQVLGRRHGRAAGRARQDDRLRHLRRRQLDPQRGRRRLERADARHDFILDPQPVQRVHLLADGAVERRLAGVQPHHVHAVRWRLPIHRDDLVQGHAGRIAAPAVRRQQAQQLRVDQRAGVDAARAPAAAAAGP